jgi:hypothetical protein
MGLTSSSPPAPKNVKDTVGFRAMTVKIPWTTADGVAAAEHFEAEQGDVLIVTYPKCGTTWCQQLCHQLRTGGHTDFEEISEERIVPWLEVSPDLGIDIRLAQTAAPRCFKTHQMLSALSRFENQGARFLCVLREPESTLVSNFKFLLTKGKPETEGKDVNAFAASYFLPNGKITQDFGGNVWDFYVEFWRCRSLPNVQVLAFEHLKQDLNSQIPVIAEFMGLPKPDGALHEKVAELGSFAWMSANDHLFDDHHVGPRIAKAKGKGKGEGKGEGKSGHASTKVGLQVGDDVNTKLSDETRASLARAWQDIVTPVTGHATYEDMIAELL